MLSLQRDQQITIFNLVTYYKLKKTGIFKEFLNDIFNNSLDKYPDSFLNGTLYHLKNQGIVMNVDNQLILTNNGKNYLQTIRFRVQVVINKQMLLAMLQYQVQVLMVLLNDMQCV